VAVIAAPPIPTGAPRGAVIIAVIVPSPVGTRIVLTRPLIAVQTAFAPPASVGYAS
jgi:hypothetical protein